MKFYDGQIPEEWLEELNDRMGEEEIPYRQRPFHALQEWTKANNCAISHTSEAAKKVFEWFYRHSPAEAHHIGPQFRGAFYYDAYFWPVDIPIAYGRVTLDPWDSLKELPETVRVRLKADTPKALEFFAVWADCMDYGFGRDDIGNTVPDSFGKRLFASANGQLDASVAMLCRARPNDKAIETARMAAEMFFKAFIALHGGLTEGEAKDAGHNLRVLLDRCLAIHPASELASLKERIGQMPPVSSRYEAIKFKLDDLWLAYGTAQFAGSALTRSLTGRNVRAEVEEKLGRYAKRQPPITP